MKTASLLGLLVFGAAAFVPIGTVAAETTFTVNSTDDVDDGTCDATHCSLREAINAANANFGADNIAFNISGAGPHTIQPLLALPPVTDPVVIDGYTQPGASPNTNPPALGTNAVLQIELDGTNAGNVNGFTISAGNSTVRGLVINRFSFNGISLITNGGNVIEGNFIGVDATGSASLGNGRGVFIFRVPDNRVGGKMPGARNVISGNSSGVWLQDAGATANVVEGNLIGTAADGINPLGNTFDGVIFTRGGPVVGASDNIVGGMASGAGNTIAFNGRVGVFIQVGSTKNAVLSNSIFSNGGLGIDLLIPFGVTPNDVGDGDTGPNNLQNFPVLTSAFKGSTTIEGTLNSTPSATFTLEFFSNSACDPTGHGEGESLLGSTMVTTDAGGDASFMVTFPTDLPTGTFITATATDPSNNTSEFSQCATVADFTIAVAPASVTVIRGEAATYTVTVGPEGGNFGGDVSLSCTGLPAQASCSFAPATVMPRASPVTSTLTVSTTAPTTPTGSFTITGTSGSLARSTMATLAVTTDFATAVTPASVTVTQSEAATYTVTVSPVGGSFDQAVSLTCSNLPSLTSCSFSPSQVTPGPSAVTSTLTVSTTAPSALLAPPLGEQELPPMFALWLERLALGFFGLVLVGVALGGRPSRRRRLGLYWPLALMLLAALTLSTGCGGDGQITSPSPGTPMGTFNFNIEGTSGSVVKPIAATLIVQ